MPDESAKPKRPPMNAARRKAILHDAGELIWRSRGRLALGLPLLLVNRMMSIILPGTTKYLIDDVIGKGRHDLLWKLAVVTALAAAIGGITDYALAQILGMAAQKSITDIRKRIQQHVQRLSVGYFDATKTGVLVSRVMNDAEGIRNSSARGCCNWSGESSRRAWPPESSSI
jgi:ABC-type multidrug transport system, ATPase and permease components